MVLTFLIIGTKKQNNFSKINTLIELSENFLNDNSYYKKLPRDPTSTIQQKVNKMISEIKKTGQFSAEIHKKITNYCGIAPKFYALPKSSQAYTVLKTNHFLKRVTNHKIDSFCFKGMLRYNILVKSSPEISTKKS